MLNEQWTIQYFNNNIFVMNKVDFIKTSDSWLNDKRNNKKQEITYSYPNFWDFTFANEKASTKKLLHPNQKNVKLLDEDKAR